MQNFTVNPAAVESVWFENENGARGAVRSVDDVRAFKNTPGHFMAVVLWDGGRTPGDNGDWEVPVSMEEAEFILKVKDGTLRAWLVVIEENELSATPV